MPTPADPPRPCIRPMPKAVAGDRPMPSAWRCGCAAGWPASGACSCTCGWVWRISPWLVRMRMEVSAPPAQQQAHGEKRRDDTHQKLGARGRPPPAVAPRTSRLARRTGRASSRARGPRRGRARRHASAAAVVRQDERRDRGQVIGIGRVPRARAAARRRGRGSGRRRRVRGSSRQESACSRLSRARADDEAQPRRPSRRRSSTRPRRSACRGERAGCCSRSAARSHPAASARSILVMTATSAVLKIVGYLSGLSSPSVTDSSTRRSALAQVVRRRDRPGCRRSR